MTMTLTIAITMTATMAMVMGDGLEVSCSQCNYIPPTVFVFLYQRVGVIHVDA